MSIKNTPTPQVEMVSELPNVREQFTEWLAREMPAGTVIGNPRWWAPKIIRAFHDYRTIARERDKLTSPGAAELPDLPDSYGDHCVTDSVRTMREPGYTADQMCAYAQAALNARAGGDYVPTVPDAVAVLASLRNQFEKLPIRREPMSGQTHSYVERDNVLALIEQAAENFSKPWPGIRDLCQPAALASQAVGVVK